jgi:hypothetical protein
MLMLMMLCSSFSNSNTRDVTSFPPIKKSRPEIKSPRVSSGKGNASHFYFLIFGTRQGWFRGSLFYYNNYIHITIYMRLESLGNSSLESLESPISLIFSMLVPLYLVKLVSFSLGNPVLLIQDSNRVLRICQVWL